jgi:hypothetical protein
MSKTRESFSTPVGRLVQGDCFVPQTKDQQGNLRVYKSGDKVGQPNPQFFVAVAFPKVDPRNPAVANAEFGAFYALLDKVARAEWPALFPNPAGPCVNPIFTMKVKDGDGVDRNGKSNATKEGFAGHWIVSFASAYAPKVVRETSPGVWETLTDPNSVKRGYFVRIAGSATGNDSPNTPGIYCNLDMVALVAYGQEIQSGPDAATAFGGAPAALPAGASATPLGGSTLPVAPVAGVPALPGAAGVPALPGAVAAVPAIPVVPVAPAGPQMTAKAGAVTYADFVAQGWTDALLISEGYMIAAAPAAPAVPVAPVQPYTGYMGVPGATAGAPAVPLAGAPIAGAPAVPAIPSVPSAIPSPSSGFVMTAKAAGQTREQFHAGQWTDAMLIEHGYMVAA